MDEIVIRGMLKWPNVPAVYGWLSLDRRGSWMIKNVSGRFERIANPAVNEFIGRNYAADDEGRWYFQNGPQRVFVALDYTPWVYRLDDAGEGLLAHTGAARARARGLVRRTTRGAAAARRTSASASCSTATCPPSSSGSRTRGAGTPERLLEDVARGEEARALLQWREHPVAPIRGAEVPGFSASCSVRSRPPVSRIACENARM